MAVRLSALSAGRPLPPGRFLVLISVRGWVDPTAVVGLEGSGQLKNPMTSSGILTLKYCENTWNKQGLGRWEYRILPDSYIWLHYLSSPLCWSPEATRGVEVPDTCRRGGGNLKLTPCCLFSFLQVNTCTTDQEIAIVYWALTLLLVSQKSSWIQSVLIVFL
jgi:hypothetical protein